MKDMPQGSFELCRRVQAIHTSHSDLDRKLPQAHSHEAHFFVFFFVAQPSGQDRAEQQEGFEPTTVVVCTAQCWPRALQLQSSSTATLAMQCGSNLMQHFRRFTYSLSDNAESPQSRYAVLRHSHPNCCRVLGWLNPIGHGLQF